MMKLTTGENIIDGIPVTIVRRRAKRIIIRVKPGGEVVVTIPPWRATLAEGAAFLASKWEWVLRTRERARFARRVARARILRQRWGVAPAPIRGTRSPEPQTRGRIRPRYSRLRSGLTSK